jgi:uncharacterized protein DUF6088
MYKHHETKTHIYMSQNKMNKKLYSIDKKMLSRIYGHDRGWVFTPSHFNNLAGRSTVGTVLQRHKDAGLIRQLARGLYDYPRKHDSLGVLAPSIDAVAVALKGRDAVRIQPSGAYAANQLGLSDQIPMKVVFLTDGRSRKVQIGNQQIILKQTTPRNMATANKISGLVIQALKHLGKDQVDTDIINKLADRLDDDQKKQLMKDIQFAPVWIADIFRKLNQGVGK